MAGIMGGGNVMIPDLIGAYTQGREVYQQNALRQAMQQYGPAAMQGDQNALAQLAQYDPKLGLELMAGRQDMDLATKQDARQERTATSGIRLDETRMEELRATGQREAQRLSMEMDATQREQALAEAQQGGKAAAVALQQGEEGWSRFIQTPGIPDDLKGVSFEDAPYMIALLTGVTEGLGGGEPMKLGASDRLVDPRTGREIVGAAPEEEFRQATPEEASGYGAVAGQFGPDGRFYAQNPPSGMAIESDGSGGFRMTQGPGVANSAKPLNEGQSKNVIYATRAEGALPGLEATAGALTSRTDQAAGAVPFGLGRDYQDPQYQLAQQAGEEFLTAILRKDTGAAITEGEQQIYGNVYLPRPGDSAEVQQQKAASRRRAVEALRRGMTPAEILALEKSNPNEPAAMEEAPATRYRYNPETDDVEPVQ